MRIAKSYGTLKQTSIELCVELEKIRMQNWGKTCRRCNSSGAHAALTREYTPKKRRLSTTNS